MEKEVINKKIDNLIAALRDKHGHVRRTAAEALSNIGDPQAVEPLISTLKDSDKYVRKAAAEALREMGRLNRSFLRSYDLFFCAKCYIKATPIKIRIGLFKRDTFLLCRHCKGSRFLMKDIKQVIGFIGGDIDGYQVEGDSVYVKLWDEEKEESRNADTDILEIRGSSKPINYALAIASLYTTLYNDVSRPREYVKGIKVVIRSVPFSEDALDLLRSKFGEITHA